MWGYDNRVRYYSKTGNTKKLAEVVAKQVGVTAKPIMEQIEDDIDILFLGGAVYAFDIDPLLKTFIHSLFDFGSTWPKVLYALTA